MQCHHYKISYAKIDENSRRYHMISHTILISSTWTGVCCWSGWPCPWSSHRSSLMILGPPLWSVLHRHSPDALSLSQADMCYCQCEWWQPCTSKNGNFKLKFSGIAGDPVASWGQMTEWYGRWTPGDAGCARPGRAAGPGELGEWLLVVDIPSVSTLNSSQDCPHTEIMYL